ncbi:PaaI family thioesterase [Pseudomarimonas salicorniae]|uniref:Thioesterase-like superfamily protein n=1 Tax=Pseudomarimonas salicorniae TaxID=2933270 RepID=A0ABT0GJ75_9GAMM|nr:hypothetical protein [Lysobacter sp. CAU 1642]MCK7594060.1 hypothetical protein [Lysobacter sp. CAU 1642]
MDVLHIDSRFCGPPRSGNGGYSCGLLGREIDGAATVRLLKPPPLDRPLQLRREGLQLRLVDGDTVIAQGGGALLEIEAPEAPDAASCREAAKHYVGFREHPFPTCFVCGPQRDEGDGLRIFPGRIDGRDLVAAPWTPAQNLGDAQGRVRPEFLWSALDCTGFFAFAPLPDGAPALLGELTARIDDPPKVGEPCIAAGWQLGSEGRKRFAGSAVYGSDGRVLALARATWIVMQPGAAGATR